ncbi:sigma-70 family RNA polymerase sigma factor [Alteromonas sp. ASW11-36]|uniref:Sigma-70 family RNA polymerase sigma factor n=1 Tax=Alteromonas arenosi TaxID=3055817 RepID=A0ABT7SWK6_9ALTE|nr:sigma-70 family RNA polymerase sigma factor [Alteromonas sp. ASW11-36]MDM7860553.1 sigma-70 family RNA polymerase sigma factor [Alteromonas sp. ASW11-36]
MNQVLDMAQGNHQAMSDFYQTYGQSVFRIAWRMSGDSSMAEDITQEVFVKIWQKAHSYNAEKGTVASWVKSITANACIDKLRKKSELSNQHQTVDALLSESLSPEATAINENYSHYVQTALMSLPERQRLAITLNIYCDASNAEAGAIMSVSEQAVESLLARARRSLSDLFERKQLTGLR